MKTKNDLTNNILKLVQNYNKNAKELKNQVPESQHKFNMSFMEQKLNDSFGTDSEFDIDASESGYEKSNPPSQGRLSPYSEDHNSLDLRDKEIVSEFNQK